MPNGLAMSFETDAGVASEIERVGFAVLAGRVAGTLGRLFASEDPPKRTVKGTRRRPGSSSSGDRERAKGPTRDERDQGGSAPPDQGGRPPQGPSEPRPPSGGASGGGMPVGGGGGGGRISPMMLIIGAVVIIGLLVCGGPSLFFNSGGGDQAAQQQPPIAEEPAQSPAAVQESLDSLVDSTSTDAAGASSESAGDAGQVVSTNSETSVEDGTGVSEGQTWTVMLYQDADDKVLEKDIYIDFNEAERIGSTDQVQIVAQVDRYRAGYNGDGDWSSTKRFFITQDGDLERARSASADLGEVNMADAGTLVDFVEWSVQNYPADKYVLIMSDHGIGWPGGWSDPEPKTAAERGAPDSSRVWAINSTFMSWMPHSRKFARAPVSINLS